FRFAGGRVSDGEEQRRGTREDEQRRSTGHHAARSLRGCADANKRESRRRLHDMSARRARYRMPAISRTPMIANTTAATFCVSFGSSSRPARLPTKTAMPATVHSARLEATKMVNQAWYFA